MEMNRSTQLAVQVPLLLYVLATICPRAAAEDDFDTAIKPILAASCVKCHCKEKTKGKVNLDEIKTEAQLLANPKLIKSIMEAVEAVDMPPETEPPLLEKSRTDFLAALRQMLRVSAANKDPEQQQTCRLNRFQYNNSIRDLFQLKTDVFRLPEKLMTRQGNYLVSKSPAMPHHVDVACHALNDGGGLKDVEPFPKDLRAQHGFDNQANQLTLSPLLLDAFLRLSVAIVESPDFNENSVGIWNDFFREPAAGIDKKEEVRKRLRRFLTNAFRRPADDAVLDRYASYTLGKMEKGLSFTDSMKKAASAILSSPKFLYRTIGARNDPFALASDLSFFLWGSAPDEELLRLAGNGELANPAVLKKTIDRMIADPKVERFLDSFPAQWMQLENVLGAAPDPKQVPYFSIDPKSSAGLQMLLEPLLLFDTVFIEDRPIADLIAPAFSYRSEFLEAWYTSGFKPPAVDAEKINAANRENEKRRLALTETIRKTQADLDALVNPIKAGLMATKKHAGGKQSADLKPYAAWDFKGDLKDSVAGLKLTAHGKIAYKDGMVVLEKAYLQSDPLPIDLKTKTLELWFKLKSVNQHGGGAMTIQGADGAFDSIVLGERKDAHWISGSNGFARTEDFEDSSPEGAVDQLLHLAMVYAEDGTTTLYRNGTVYGKPYKKGVMTFPKNQTTVLFGLRHVPEAKGKYLSMSLARARLYDRALSADEIAVSSGGENLFISEEELLSALDPEQKSRYAVLKESLKRSETELKNVPKPVDLAKQQQEVNERFDDDMRRAMRSSGFQRIPLLDPRYGGVITNAATLTMTSSPTRTLPIARGAWIIEVILNDPPPPPPNDVPPLNEDTGSKELTIREKFAKHRENPSCAGCHARIDPLGFALENFDIAGRWRDRYDNGRSVDPSGTLLKKHAFKDVVEFKESLLKEKKRFAKAFTAHLLRFALARELTPADAFAVDQIVEKTAGTDFKLKAIIREILCSSSFRRMD
ncbi:MAG: DUF1588 domain-containing protein [Planctomycetota bacterium]